ncbi:hypothetical protein BSKO_09018 [Bryopsis sp. KO-2023]|nr:hypothetical protein BSKO_09018 [Bryopsis sp. KO-2023]
MGKDRLVWPRTSRPEDFKGDAFSDEVQGRGMNRPIPEVQVLMQPNWIKFDPRFYSGSAMYREKDADGSQSSTDTTLDLAPLTMARKRSTILTDGSIPLVSQTLRQKFLVRRCEGYELLPKHILSMDESHLNDDRPPLLLDRVLANGKLGMQPEDVSHPLTDVSLPSNKIASTGGKNITVDNEQSKEDIAIIQPMAVKGVRKGEDAVDYFMRSTHKQELLIHCNIRSQDLEYDPYDLVVVNQDVANPEHIVISQRGVTHIRPGEPSDIVTHDQWLDERKLFMVLKKTAFFGNNTLVKGVVWTKVPCSWEKCLRGTCPLFLAMWEAHRLDPEVWRERTDKTVPSVGWRNHSITVIQETENKEKAAHGQANDEFDRLKRFIRRIDIMFTTSLAYLGVDACNIALEELMTVRRQGLFIVSGQLFNQSERSNSPRSQQQPACENDIRFTPVVEELLAIVQGIPSSIVTLVGSAPRILLMPQFQNEMAEVLVLAEKGRISATTDLLCSFINVRAYQDKVGEMISAGYTEVIMDPDVTPFARCGPLHAFARGFTRESYFERGPSSCDYLKDIECLEGWSKSLVQAPVAVCRGPIHLDLEALKEKLVPLAERTLGELTCLADKVLSDNCAALGSLLETYIAKLSSIPLELSEFASFVKSVQEHLGEDGLYRTDVQARKESAEILFNLLRQKSLMGAFGQTTYPTADVASEPKKTLRNELKDTWSNLKEILRRYEGECISTAKEIELQRPSMIDECMRGCEKVKKEISIQLSRLRKGKLTDIECDADVASREVNVHRLKLSSAREHLSDYIKFYLQLSSARDHPQFKEVLELLDQSKKVVERRSSLWSLISAWGPYADTLCGTDMMTTEQVDTNILAHHLEELIKEIEPIEALPVADDAVQFTTSTPQEARLAAKIRTIVTHWTRDLPLLRNLFNPVVKVRHRRHLVAWIGLVARPDRGSQTPTDDQEQEVSGCQVSVSLFLSRANQLEDSHHMIGHTYEVAEQEHKLEQEIVKSHDLLSRTRVGVENHSVHYRTIVNLPEVHNAIHQARSILRDVARSPWVGGVSKYFQQEQRNIVSVLKAVQYQDCKEKWFDVLRHTLERRGRLLTCVHGAEGLSSCIELNTRLEQVLRSCYRILTSMRQTWPRLHFVNDEQLFNSLTTHSLDTGPLLSVIRQVIPGVRDVIVQTTDNSTLVKMVVGWGGERVRLICGVAGPGKDRLPEDFMRDLENALTSSIYEWTRHCLESCESKETEDVQWISSYPCQCILLADAVLWNTNVEEVLKKASTGNYSSIANFREGILSQLETLGDQLRAAGRVYVDALKSADDNVLADCRQHITNLRVMIAAKVCHREVATRLLDGKITDPHDFEWFSQLHYTWTPGPATPIPTFDLNVALADVQMKYGYEYQTKGHQSTLLTLPMTPREILSVSNMLGTPSCIRLVQGSIKPGTSYFETCEVARATAAAFGRYFVEVPCWGGESFINTLDRVMVGLSCCAAWGILSQSELLKPEVHSWIHWRISTLANKVSVDKRRSQQAGTENCFRLFLSEGHRISCGSSDQETKLASSSASVFRSVAIRVTEPLLILLEVCLKRLGLRRPRDGAKLAILLFEEIQERLPKRPEYGFGLRLGKRLVAYLEKAFAAKESVNKDESRPPRNTWDAFSIVSNVDSVEALCSVTQAFLKNIVHQEDTIYISGIVSTIMQEGAESGMEEKAIPSGLTHGTISQHDSFALSFTSRMERIFFQLADKNVLGRVASSIINCLSMEKSVIVLGSPRSGKTACLRYVMDQMSKSGRKSQIRKIYPGSLTLEELWGDERASESSNRQVTKSHWSKTVSKVREAAAQEQGKGDRSASKAAIRDICRESSWVVLDGPLTSDVSDSIAFILNRETHNGTPLTFASILHGEVVIWETDSLRGASPSICTAPVVHVPDLTPHFDSSWCQLTKELQSSIVVSEECESQDLNKEIRSWRRLGQDIFDFYSGQFDKLDSYSRCLKDTETKKARLGWRIMTLFSFLVDEASHVSKGHRLARNIGMGLIYSFAWGLGCSVREESVKLDIERAIRESVASNQVDIPLPEGSIYEHLVCFESMKWTKMTTDPLHATASPRIENISLFHTAFLATAAIVRISLKAGLCVALVGPENCDKNSVARGVFDSEAQENRGPTVFVAMAKGLRACDIRENMESEIRESGYEEHSHASKRTLIHVCDMFIQYSKETSSSLEFFRECADSNGFIDGQGNR